jgi:hypothetical protein
MGIAQPRQTLALTDTESGWVFRLHKDDGRVWVDSLAFDVPVPVTFLAGDRAGEFEAAIGNSRTFAEMRDCARRMLPERITVSFLDS